jgi:hypothetical protein
MKVVFRNLRRWTTGLFLGLACLMLFLGLTIFSGHLQQASFVIYWLVCFLFTGLAAILALVDVMIIRKKSRDEQRDLIKRTFEDPKENGDGFKDLDSQ